MSNYLEEGYREFEERYFYHVDFWRAPASELRDTFLFPVFERFAKSFPDHPHDKNTVFYMTESPNISPVDRSIVLTCDHFEHTSNDDLHELLSFMKYASGILIEGDMVFLERLDSACEEIIMKFCDPRMEVVEVFQKFPRKSHRIGS